MSLNQIARGLIFRRASVLRALHNCTCLTCLQTGQESLAPAAISRKGSKAHSQNNLPCPLGGRRESWTSDSPEVKWCILYQRASRVDFRYSSPLLCQNPSGFLGCQQGSGRCPTRAQPTTSHYAPQSTPEMPPRQQPLKQVDSAF